MALTKKEADELRDRYIIAALTGLCANPNLIGFSTILERSNYQQLVRTARRLADDMLIEREE